MKADSIEQVPEKHNHPAIWLIRLAIAVNFIRFALSFSSQFEGTAETAGLADKMFKLRWGGFRVDFVWLVISTIVIFFAMFYFLLNLKNDPKAKIDAIFCIAWVIAFSIFIARAFLTGIIDFG